jgi:hypothetical protein
MSITTLLSQPFAATELLVINLIAQHDPESDSEFSSCSHSRFPYPLLHQFAPIEAFQLRIPPDGMHRRLTPQITQKRISLFAHRAQPLAASTGVFAVRAATRPLRRASERPHSGALSRMNAVCSSEAQNAQTVAPKVTVRGNLEAKANSPAPPATAMQQSQKSQ